jgi:heptosyltransferase II
MKIMIRGTNWIGDAVMSIPALRQLHRVFHDSRLTLYTRPWAEGIFRDADFFDEILTFDKKKRSVQALKDEVKLISAEQFDLAILLTNSFESALVTKLAGIPRRIGFNKDLRGLLLTDPIAVPEWKGRTHEVYYYLALAAEVEKRVLGRTTVSGEPDASLAISDSRRTEAVEFLGANGANLKNPIVALGVGSKNSRAKRWPAERYSQLADQLFTRTGANVVLVGAPDEVDVAASVQATARSPLIDVTGGTDLALAAAILAVADLFISNDMGLAHVAAAAGTDTLVIFGPTNDVTTRPFAVNAIVIRHHVECSPCVLRDCPIDHRCMTRVGVDEVFEAAVARLSRQSEINNINEESSIY